MTRDQLFRRSFQQMVQRAAPTHYGPRTWAEMQERERDLRENAECVEVQNRDEAREVYEELEDGD